MQSLKIYIGIPCYGNSMTITTFNSLHRLSKYFFKEKIDFDIFTIGQESLIPRARNFLASKMLENKSNYTHLLFIDADIGFQIENILRLINFDKDIVCGTYPIKQFQWNKLLKKLSETKNINEEFLKNNSLKFAVDFEDPTNIKTINGFAKVRHGATGLMLIKRQVLEKLINEYPDIEYKSEHDESTMYDFFQTGIIDVNKIQRYISEDWYFCHLWTKLGGEVWADLASPITHFGNHEFSGSLLGSAKKK